MLRRHQITAGVGTAHFITTVTRRRGRWFIEPQICTELLSILENYRHRFEAVCYGYVLMPDHLHVILLQQRKDDSVSRVMEHFKRFTSRRLLRHHCPDANGWRAHFDDVLLPGTDALRTKLNYMHANPVQAGLADSPHVYPWSSYRYYSGCCPWDNSIITLIPNLL